MILMYLEFQDSRKKYHFGEVNEMIDKKKATESIVREGDTLR